MRNFEMCRTELAAPAPTCQIKGLNLKTLPTESPAAEKEAYERRPNGPLCGTTVVRVCDKTNDSRPRLGGQEPIGE
jgi:hypothetical protein